MPSCLLAPVIVALVSSVLEGGGRDLALPRRAARSAAARPLDETANCAPLQDLPAYLSQLAAHRVRDFRGLEAA